jgi:FlgD Ig-like domain
VARIASTVLVVALLAGTAAAFALTQGLKLQKSPIFGTEPAEVFSPVCGCEKEVATIGFKLRERDRLDVSIVDGDAVVRTLERNRSYPAGKVVIEWDGRDDSGRVLPEGEYEPRVRLHGGHQTITLLGSPIRIDVTPPVLQDVSVRPRARVFSPDGDRRRDLLRLRYRLSEPGRAELYVDGKRRVRTLFPRTQDKIDWSGKVDGRALAPGTYAVQLAAFDPAGNRTDLTPRIDVTVRYVALGRKRIVALAGQRFALRVSSDARRVRWTLGARSGVAAPGTLRLRAPLQPGRFTLTLSANGHTARAAVLVREPAR